MSEMIERIEKAIREASVPHGDMPGDTRSLSYYASVGIDHFRHDHDRLDALISIAARAAIEVMREPTNDMLLARNDGVDGGSSVSQMRKEWRAMITAALEGV